MTWWPSGHLVSPSKAMQKKVYGTFSSTPSQLISLLVRSKGPVNFSCVLASLSVPVDKARWNIGQWQWKKRNVVSPPVDWLRKRSLDFSQPTVGITVPVFTGQTSPSLLNTISCNLHRYYLQRDGCCVASSPAESHPLSSLSQKLTPNMMFKQWEEWCWKTRFFSAEETEGMLWFSQLSETTFKFYYTECSRILLDALTHCRLESVNKTLISFSASCSPLPWTPYIQIPPLDWLNSVLHAPRHVFLCVPLFVCKWVWVVCNLRRHHVTGVTT